MIKSHRGEVKIEGRRAEVLADLTVVTQEMMESLIENGNDEEEVKRQIMNAVDVGIRRASSDYEENPVEKKVRELIEEIVKSMGGDRY